MTRRRRNLLVALSAVAAGTGFMVARLRHATAGEDTTGGKSYCVGGFEFDDNKQPTRDQCDALSSRHPGGWHLHGFALGRDGKCYVCWDEVDMTCETLMPQEKPFKYLGGSPSDCNNHLAADPDTTRRIYVPDKSSSSPEPTASPSPTPTARPIPSPDPGVASSPAPDLGMLRPLPPVVVPEPEPDEPDEPEPPTKAGDPPRPPRAPRATPKPARVVSFTAQISHVSQGPYAVGDPVQVEALVVGDDGKMRKSRTGNIIVSDSTGTELLKVPAQAQPNGTVSAEIKLPKAGALVLTYVPTAITLPPSEKQGPITSTPFPIAASSCRLRGVVSAPKNGEILVAEAPMTLRGQVKNLSGAAVGPDQFNGAKAVFTVDLSGGRSFKLDAVVSPSGDATAPLTLPAPSASTEDVVVRLLGEGGANDFCADTPVTARITLLGIGMAMTLPPNCYSDRPCDVGMMFQLPDAPDARTAGMAFLASPDLKVQVVFNGAPEGDLHAPAQTDPSSPWSGKFTPKKSGLMEVQLLATAGGKEVREKRSVRIREPIELQLPEELDLGTVPAGSDWRTTCKTLDFGKSRGVIEQVFKLVSTKPKGCDSTPAVKAGGLGYGLPKGIEFELGRDLKTPICLIDVPRCSSESPEPVILTVSAKSPDFPDQVRTVRVRWKVSGRNFLACHWWWLAAAAGIILFLIVAYGYVSPYSFAVHDSVKLAAKREGLARATARRLRELPGGRAGFYRSSTTGLREDGSATNKLGTASVVLVARKGEVILKSRGGLMRVSPQSKKLEPVDTGDAGHVASKNIVYNVGSLFFLLS